MQASGNTIESKKIMSPNLPYSSIIVVYKSSGNTWRGFVMPYDITYESSSKAKVLKVLREMIPCYESGLKKYDKPYHLTSVPLSDKEDRNKFNSISMDLMNILLARKDKIARPDYYAEAKLPA